MHLHTKIKEVELNLRAEEGVFSPRGVDRGTLAMLSVAEMNKGDKVLDLGCGYGVVGIYAAKILQPEDVVMIDVEQQAVELSRENASLNGVENVRILQGDAFQVLDDKDFSVILSNPPYHTDFSVPKRFIEKGFNRLCIGGRLYMVTKRKDWYKNKLVSIFGGVRIWEIDGYFVFMSVKKAEIYANAAKKGQIK